MQTQAAQHTATRTFRVASPPPPSASPAVRKPSGTRQVVTSQSADRVLLLLLPLACLNSWLPTATTT
jgi:hypothetical protein